MRDEFVKKNQAFIDNYGHYSQIGWLSSLTDDQVRFLEDAIDRSYESGHRDGVRSKSWGELAWAWLSAALAFSGLVLVVLSCINVLVGWAA